MPLVGRQDHSPLASHHVLCHVKAKATETTECAGLFIFVDRFDGVSAVFNNRKSAPLRNHDESVHVASAAGEVDRHDGFGTARDFGRHLLRIDIEGRRVHVDQNGLSPRMKLHGMSKDAWQRFSDEGYKHYYVVECGYKYNMMDIQAAIGIHQLRRTQKNWERRQEIWATYQKEFAGLPLTLPAQPDEGTHHAYHLYTVLIDPKQTNLTRDQFITDMTAENIGVGVHYQSIPVHPCYQERFGWEPEEHPHSLRIGQQTVSLPLSPKLTDHDVADVVRAVHKVLHR